MKKSTLIIGTMLFGTAAMAFSSSDNPTSSGGAVAPSDNWASDIPKFGDYPEGHIKESFLGKAGSRTLYSCNNPGSIKQFRSDGRVISPNDPWKGAIPWQENTDGDFVQFTSFAWGLRASIKLLQNYIDREGRDTLRKIIQFWDLGNPNYLNFLVTNTGFTADQNLAADKPTLEQIVRYITVMEQGWQHDVVTNKRFETAYSLL